MKHYSKDSIDIQYRTVNYELFVEKHNIMKTWVCIFMLDENYRWYESNNVYDAVKLSMLLMQQISSYKSQISKWNFLPSLLWTTLN